MKPKKYGRRLFVVLELVPDRGGKHLRPRPQNRSLVLPWVLFKNSDERPLFFKWKSLPGHGRSREPIRTLSKSFVVGQSDYLSRMFLKKCFPTISLAIPLVQT